MSSTIVLASILVLIIAGFFILNKINRNRIVTDDHHSHENTDGECCGKHSNCSKGYDTANLYFEDEELDRFKGTKQEDYTDADIEEFRQCTHVSISSVFMVYSICLNSSISASV